MTLSLCRKRAGNPCYIVPKPALRRMKSPWISGIFDVVRRPPEPKVTGSNPVGDTRIIRCHRVAAGLNSLRFLGVEASTFSRPLFLQRLGQSHGVAPDVTGLYKPCANR